MAEPITPTPSGETTRLHSTHAPWASAASMRPCQHMRRDGGKRRVQIAHTLFDSVCPFSSTALLSYSILNPSRSQFILQAPLIPNPLVNLLREYSHAYALQHEPKSMLAQRARPTIARPPLSVRQVSRRQPQLPQRPKRCMAALQEGRRVIALFKRLGMPRRLHRRGMKFEEAREVAVAWLKTPEAAKARRRLYAKSWSRRRAIKGKDATEVRIERARLRRRPPSAACEPSRWNLVRNAVRVRSIAFYWMGETVATLCAPDGRYSLEDLEAFLRDLEECEGENAC